MRPIFFQINRETHELTNLTLLSGRNASITLGKGYDDFATFGQLDEGILSIAGRTVESGTLADMRHLTRTSIAAELDRPPDLSGIAGVHAVRLDGAQLRCEVDTARLQEVLEAL